MRFTNLMVIFTNIPLKMNRADIEMENMWMARKNYHSEGGRAPRKQGRHQQRRYQQCDASVGSRALTPAASPLHLTILVPVVATSTLLFGDRRLCSSLVLTGCSAVQTSEHFVSWNYLYLNTFSFPNNFKSEMQKGKSNKEYIGICDFVLRM
jgi:hypothetical protein